MNIIPDDNAKGRLFYAFFGTYQKETVSEDKGKRAYRKSAG